MLFVRSEELRLHAIARTARRVQHWIPHKVAGRSLTRSPVAAKPIK
jgi:hypothetical protein